MAAKIRHLVFSTTDVERLAQYYVDVFGMTITHRSNKEGISLTDGYLDLSIHKNKMNGKPSGFNHFGFQVDDNEEFVAKCQEHGYPVPEKRPADRHFTEYRGMDPDGNNYDLSTNGYMSVRPDRVPEAAEMEVIRKKQAQKEKV